MLVGIYIDIFVILDDHHLRALGVDDTESKCQTVSRKGIVGATKVQTN